MTSLRRLSNTNLPIIIASTPWHSTTGLGYRHETLLSKRLYLKTTHAPFIKLHGYFGNYADIHRLYENDWTQDKKLTMDFSYDYRIQLTIAVHYSLAFSKALLGKNNLFWGNR